MIKELRITIPGEPVAQGRGRIVLRGRTGKRVVCDPLKSRAWKLHAALVMRRHAGDRCPFPSGPLEVHVTAVFACPRSSHLVRSPRARRPHATRPDIDNIAKAVQDAGNGSLWTDDSQVARLVVEKFVGAQGEAPYVELVVHRLDAVPDR